MNCTVCHHPHPTDADTGVCEACQHRLRYVLRQLVAELPLLQAELAPYRSPRVGSLFGSRAAHAPLPLDARVVDLLATKWLPAEDGQDAGDIPIGPLLVGWCTALAADYPAIEHRGGTTWITPGTEPWPAAGGIPGWATWLRAYTGFAATWQHAPDLWADFEDALRRVRAITGTQPRTRALWAPCPSCEAFGLARTDGHWHVRCHNCGRRLTPDQYAAHAAETAARATEPAHPTTPPGEAA